MNADTEVCICHTFPAIHWTIHFTMLSYFNQEV
jgi:hypothetical protein